MIHFVTSVRLKSLFLQERRAVCLPLLEQRVKKFSLLSLNIGKTGVERVTQLVPAMIILKHCDQ